MSRFATLRRNAGTFAVVQTVVVHLAVAAIPLVGLLKGGLGPSALIVAIVAWLVPFLARRWLVDRPAQTHRGLKFFAWGLIGLTIVGRQLLAPLGEELGATLIVGVLALYISAYFWFMSDPQIEITR